MKDYAKKNILLNKPNRNRQAPRYPSFDQWLIVFIILTIVLALFSASHTVYRNWAEKRTQTSQSIETKIPAKSTLEKTSHKEASEKREPHDTDKTKISAKTVKNAEKAAAIKPLASNEPKYDFYQLLPKMTVDVPDDDDETPPAH